MLSVLLPLIILLPLYFVPTWIAIKKEHPQKVPIILVNLIGGLIWGLGWLAALVWCFIEPAQKNNTSTDVATEIEKLHELREKGILTSEEFDRKKQELLA
jgi:type VI protein secretion system component VasK